MGVKGSRELILQRIRDGLRVAVAAPPRTESGPIFEHVANPLERFQIECKANLIALTLSHDANESRAQLKAELDSLAEGEIHVQDSPVLRSMIEAIQINRPVKWSSQGAPAEASQATVSLAEALVAQTGSIFVSAACGGRGISVVAPCHIVFATVGQLVPDLETALRNATAQGMVRKNSFACMISGSSRTADIEKILVQGAHGPRRLAVILQQS
ncbi:MAG TPA: LUD domain-containing protein [Candidatus Angelobacter sp.]|jgi:L-lactate dehydrogenase complex protein LldG|nr:LUD domain-containing protein [Candidatus Angelobacter sp.]